MRMNLFWFHLDWLLFWWIILNVIKWMEKKQFQQNCMPESISSIAIANRIFGKKILLSECIGNANITRLNSNLLCNYHMILINSFILMIFNCQQIYIEIVWVISRSESSVFVYFIILYMFYSWILLSGMFFPEWLQFSKSFIS